MRVQSRMQPDRLGAVSIRLKWHLSRWWQVLGSNQRRLSRRFYRPLPLATRATCLVPPQQGSTVKDSGTGSNRQHADHEPGS
jgi:hypothetical protein